MRFLRAECGHGLAAKLHAAVLRCIFFIVLSLSCLASALDVHYEYNIRSELTRVMRGDEVLYGYEYDLSETNASLLEKECQTYSLIIDANIK